MNMKANAPAEPVSEAENKIARAEDTAKCPSCGGVLVYSPSKKALCCTYCGNTAAMPPLAPARPKDYKAEGNFEAWDTRLNAFKCSACGALSELSKYETGLSCPFCGAPNLIKLEDAKGLRPTAILPFLLDREAAAGSYKLWIKKRIFAPSDLKKKFDEKAMSGIFIPCFTFSFNTFSKYEGTLGKYYTVTVGSGKNRRTERRIRYFHVSGTHSDSFSNLMYEVSSKIDQRELNKIGKFDITNAVEYTTEYIPGFSQERYTEPLDKTYERAQGQAYNSIKSRIVNHYNADVVQNLSISTDYSGVNYHYLMSPIWECFYKYKKKGYRMIINGRNGFVAGKAPVSPWRVLIAGLLGAALIAGIAALMLLL